MFKYVETVFRKLPAYAIFAYRVAVRLVAVWALVELRADGYEFDPSATRLLCVFFPAAACAVRELSYATGTAYYPRLAP